MPLTDPILAANLLAKVGQQLLSTRQAYLDPSAVLIGQPPGYQQLDEWTQQVNECEAAMTGALTVVRGSLRDVRAIVDKGKGYAGRW